MPAKNWPEWEEVLSAAARLQEYFPDAVLVGGTAAAYFAEHRMSIDADHVLPDLKNQFDQVLAELESVAGWKTARVLRPVQILGSLDGIETGIRQLIRDQPLETTTVNFKGKKIVLPTEEEILRIKGVLILKRNASRDYIDFIALADRMGPEKIVEALKKFSQFYPQEGGKSALLQLQIQLANPLPYDLKNMDLSTYKGLESRWHDWTAVKAVALQISILVFDRILGTEENAG
ncbi:MAG: nucleotidyl transferase AbiEii/AbiGii toxin family protein [Elusimicrobia bacterium]|jgi:hypothetical protein|nr:nucleotidyl transferase AbiEii/AbiGii toxin family protein [Elusimicrobiota bacterium]